jgi:hypothetical protein
MGSLGERIFTKTIKHNGLSETKSNYLAGGFLAAQVLRHFLTAWFLSFLNFQNFLKVINLTWIWRRRLFVLFEV